MKTLTTLSVLSLFVCSCSINYHARAVEKARAKAVEELNLLDDADRFEVKFGQPLIFRRRIINRSGSAHISNNDLCHIWIVWKLPGTEGKDLIVSGVSEARMDDWHPAHVFLRNIDDLTGDEKLPEDEK